METLKELTDRVFAGMDIREQQIGIYEGKGKPIYPDYADEILETHGDYVVTDYAFSKDGILVVALTEKK